jgi:hypothetical protein
MGRDAKFCEDNIRLINSYKIPELSKFCETQDVVLEVFDVPQPRFASSYFNVVVQPSVFTVVSIAFMHV